MRKGFDGLQGLVSGVLGQDPLSGHLFLFVNRRRDRLSSPIRHAHRTRCRVLSFPAKMIGSLETTISKNWRRAIGRCRQNYGVLAGHWHNRLWKEPEYHKRQIDFFKRYLDGLSLPVESN